MDKSLVGFHGESKEKRVGFFSEAQGLELCLLCVASLAKDLQVIGSVPTPHTERRDVGLFPSAP